MNLRKDHLHCVGLKNMMDSQAGANTYARSAGVLGIACGGSMRLQWRGYYVMAGIVWAVALYICRCGCLNSNIDEGCSELRNAKRHAKSREPIGC